MDPVYEKAQRRREALRKEIEEIDLFLKLHMKFSGDNQPEDNQERSTEPKPERRFYNFGADASAPPETKEKRPRPTRNMPKHVMAQVVRDLLVEERRKPMTRTEIVDALELKGMPVAGVDPSKALGTILWRLRDKFVNLPGFGYWPVGLEYSPAGYIPWESEKPQTALGLPKPDVFE